MNLRKRLGEESKMRLLRITTANVQVFYTLVSRKRVEVAHGLVEYIKRECN